MCHALASRPGRSLFRGPSSSVDATSDTCTPRMTSTSSAHWLAHKTTNYVGNRPQRLGQIRSYGHPLRLCVLDDLGELHDPRRGVGDETPRQLLQDSRRQPWSRQSGQGIDPRRPEAQPRQLLQGILHVTRDLALGVAELHVPIQSGIDAAYLLSDFPEVAAFTDALQQLRPPGVVPGFLRGRLGLQRPGEYGARAIARPPPHGAPQEASAAPAGADPPVTFVGRQTPAERRRHHGAAPRQCQSRRLIAGGSSAGNFGPRSWRALASWLEPARWQPPRELPAGGPALRRAARPNPR